jgi:hypothetical protein
MNNDWERIRKECVMTMDASKWGGSNMCPVLAFLEDKV